MNHKPIGLLAVINHSSENKTKCLLLNGIRATTNSVESSQGFTPYSYRRSKALFCSYSQQLFCRLTVNVEKNYLTKICHKYDLLILIFLFF